MKMNQLGAILVLFVLLNTQSTVTAQITIGSTDAPMSGSLLDLKENANGTSTRGLGLPRVTLPDINLLTLADPSENLIHTGLLVYNIGCTAVEKGIYVWMGDKWAKVAPPKTSTYPGANSYIATPNQTIAIPIQRAFSIWENFSGNTPSTGQVLDKASVNNLNGILTATVVWEQSEASGTGVINKTGANYDVSISGTGASAQLNVTTGNQYGNAVVAVRIGAGLATDPILWSWHIWVPYEDPNTANAKVYCHNGYTFMDRNMGALKAVAGDAQSRGLHYQWGRKDPFPCPMDWTYNNTNVTLGYGATDYTMSAGYSEKTNFEYAIQNPSGYIRSSNDWYSRNIPTNQYAEFWGATETKSPFDPCPTGWRVPAMKADLLSVWSRYGNNDKFRTTGFSSNRGRTLNAADYNLGYYPANGIRDAEGAFETYQYPYIWMANILYPPDYSPAAYYGHGYVFAIGLLDIWPLDNKVKAKSMGVRCVLE